MAGAEDTSPEEIVVSTISRSWLSMELEGTTNKMGANSCSRSRSAFGAGIFANGQAIGQGKGFYLHLVNSHRERGHVHTHTNIEIGGRDCFKSRAKSFLKGI